MLQKEKDGWVVDLRNGFQLIAPTGLHCHLAYRKVEELLVALANSPERTIEREDLAALLWPEASFEKRQVNLRQATYRLRQVLGPDSLQADGETCILKIPVRVEADTSAAVEPPLADACDTNPIAGFVQLLRWFSERDPLQMLDLMRANMDLSLGIWPSDLRSLLDSAALRLPIYHRLIGWVSFWRGYEGVHYRDIERSSSLFALAVDQAVEERDYELAAEAILWLGGSEILLRRFDSAKRIVERGAHMVALLNDKAIRAKIEQLRGTLLIHQARTQEGLKILEESGGANDHRLLDHAQSEALRGLYHACAGESVVAMRLLEQPRRIAEETKHFRLNAICKLGTGYAAMAQGDPEHALQELGHVVTMAAHAELMHFEIYGREASAVSLLQLDRREEAAKHLESSRNIRRALKMRYTEWDRLRLRLLAPSDQA